MTDQPTALRIVRGTPTDEELAAVTALVSARPAPVPDERRPPTRARWNDPAWSHRRFWPTGPGAWRAAAR